MCFLSLTLHLRYNSIWNFFLILQKDITNYVHILAYYRTLWDEAAEEAVVKTDEATDRIGLRISSSDKHFVVVKNFE